VWLWLCVLLCYCCRIVEVWGCDELSHLDMHLTLLYDELTHSDLVLVRRAGGTVYLAKDVRSDELVAVKLCPATDIENLKNEIALQRLSAHECIVGYKETYMAKDQLWVSLPWGAWLCCPFR
jgi:hypothetical protein